MPGRWNRNRSGSRAITDYHAAVAAAIERVWRQDAADTGVGTFLHAGVEGTALASPSCGTATPGSSAPLLGVPGKGFTVSDNRATHDALEGGTVWTHGTARPLMR